MGWGGGRGGQNIKKNTDIRQEPSNQASNPNSRFDLLLTVIVLVVLLFLALVVSEVVGQPGSWPDCAVDVESAGHA